MGRTEQGRPRRRQKKRMQRHRRSVLAVSAVVLLLFVVISANSVSLKAKEEHYRAQEMELEEQIEEEKARTKEIEEYEKYTQTMKYKEEVARDRLGLVYEGEILFKDEN